MNPDQMMELEPLRHPRNLQLEPGNEEDVAVNKETEDVPRRLYLEMTTSEG